MKKEIIKIIPAVKARPASKKTLAVNYCDFCNKRSADYYGNERKCMVCDRDICREHRHADPRDIGDYPGYYCPTCIRLYYDKYQKLINNMEKRHWCEEQALLKDVKKESLNE